MNETEPPNRPALAYTPGPWRLHVGSADWGMPMTHIIYQDGAANIYENVIAEIPSVQPYCMGATKKDLRRSNVQSANARLITAAPALLPAVEACYMLLGTTGHEWPGRNTLEGQALLSALRDAICKATGREAQDVQDDYCNRIAKTAPRLREKWSS